jgi:hypothetical protein
MDNAQYISSRKIAIIITMLVLLFGTIIYFATNIAERNNDIMYKEIYGENAILNSASNNINNVNETKINIKIALV